MMQTWKILGIGGLGVYMVAMGYYMIQGGFQMILDWQIGQKVSIQNGSEVYPFWKKIDFLEFNVYIFNVTNPDEFSKGAKPVVREVGPFCFKLNRIKEELDVDEEEDSVLYHEIKYFYPSQVNTVTSQPCVSLDTEVTIINIALVATVQLLGVISPDFLGTFGEAVPLLFPGIQNAFQTVKARDILFDGVPLNCSTEDFTLGMVCKGMKEMAPPQLRQHDNGVDFTFAMFRFMNATKDGPYRVMRGTKNATEIGRILEWKNERLQKVWPTDECNAYRGTDGYILAPLKPGQRTIAAFSTDACRSMELTFIEDRDVFGITAKHFEVVEEALAVNDETRCYCPRVKEEDDEGNEHVETRCLKKGVLNVGPCVGGAPIIISWPHFYLADESYVNAVDGVKPDREKHATAANILAMMGAPLSGAKRAQINLDIKQVDEIEQMTEITEVILPVLWIEEGAMIPKDFRTLLKALITLLKLSELMLYGMVISGVGCIIACVALLVYRGKIKTKEDDFLPPVQPFMYGNHANTVYGANFNAGYNPRMNRGAMVDQYNAMNHMRNMDGPPPDFKASEAMNGGSVLISSLAPQYNRAGFYN